METGSKYRISGIFEPGPGFGIAFWMRTGHQGLPSVPIGFKPLNPMRYFDWVVTGFSFF
jgi:hypothetical protein